MKKYKALTILLLLCLGIPNAWSFCGFFVAKADATLFNESSQVIIVRDGERSTITMSNDFKGDLKDFAMVVPVPVVLKESDIKVMKHTIFDKLDSYSAPRLAEYYDRNPCQPIYYLDGVTATNASTTREKSSKPPRDLRPKKSHGVTIEAKYTVGEYDILILSAKESSGLKLWLDENDYKIPAGAEEVLDPYIKSDMKFFVAKVNIDKMEKSGFTLLKPLQISFESSKFMLPIRLGMANANGDQDMMVYAFTRNGRIETTNYRTVKVPTNNEVPVFIKDDFGDFYKDVYKTAHRRENGRVVFLEYAWDLSANNVQKCDPCVSPPPILADMQEAGVDWLSTPNNTFSSQYTGNVFFTRLHVRYNRENFPQDLFFQETPNKERHQARYVIRHAATGDLKCDQGQAYIREVVDRREKELHQLANLTGWNIMKYQDYVSSYAKNVKGEPVPEKEEDCDCANDVSKSGFFASNDSGDESSGRWIGILVLAFFVALVVFSRRAKV